MLFRTSGANSIEPIAVWVSFLFRLWSTILPFPKFACLPNKRTVHICSFCLLGYKECIGWEKGFH